MKISNFRLVEVIGNSAIDWKFRAVVDITTGLFKKKTTEREVYKDYAGYWYFSDTGEFTPEYKVENLSRAYEAQKGKPLEQCKGEL